MLSQTRHDISFTTYMDTPRMISRARKGMWWIYMCWSRQASGTIRPIAPSLAHQSTRQIGTCLVAWAMGTMRCERHLSRHESESAAWSRKQASGSMEELLSSVYNRWPCCPATTRTQFPVSSKLLAFKTTKIERTQLRCTDTLDHWNGAAPGDATEFWYISYISIYIWRSTRATRLSPHSPWDDIWSAAW